MFGLGSGKPRFRLSFEIRWGMRVLFFALHMCVGAFMHSNTHVHISRIHSNTLGW